MNLVVKTSLVVSLSLSIGCGSVDDKTTTGKNNGTNNSTNNSNNGTNASNNGSQGASCQSDSDCGLGTVCAADKTCTRAACEFCTVTQVCYKPTPDSAGSCSAGASNNGMQGEACNEDIDCSLGAVCSNDDVCVRVSCDFCTVSQICYKPNPDSLGTCSAPE